MTRAPASGIKLSMKDAAVVKGVIERGYRQHDQHDIAAWFEVNGDRIAAIATGEEFSEAEAATKNLPLLGPHVTGRDAHAAKYALEEGGRTVNAALALTREQAEAAERHRGIVWESEPAE